MKNTSRPSLILAATVLCTLGTSAWAADPAATCESSQLKATSKYLSCVLGADSKAAKSGGEAVYTKCNMDKVTAAEDKAGEGVCPNITPVADLQAYLDQCAETVATALGGGDLPPDPAVCEAALTNCEVDLAACQAATCGNGVLEAGEDCEVNWAGGTTFDTGSTCAGEGFAAGSLACGSGCVYVTSGCRNQVCGDGFVDAPEQCDDGNVVNGDGCDSTCQNEAAPARFVDNGDGTITDNQTGLVWEKKSDNGDIHDKDNFFALSADVSFNPDGTAYTVFLPALNNGNFAGHNDWRLPTIEELKSLLNGNPSDSDPTTNLPYTYPIFKDGAVAGCDATAVSCSWTSLLDTLSVTTVIADPDYAWVVSFYYGSWFYDYAKNGTGAVRAVRSGS